MTTQATNSAATASNTTVKIVPAHQDHAAEIARICFEAFGTLQDRHGVARDFASTDVTSMVVGMMLSRPDVAGFTAIDAASGRILGSNFLLFSDAVAGIGPITVDPTVQARGVGRELMLAVMNEAKRRNIVQVRLLQECINTASLSLYTKLGFDWRDSCALMDPATASTAGSGVSAVGKIREMTEADLDAVEAISKRQYHSSRRNEVATALAMHFPAFVIESSGRVSGYYLPGMLGHGFAETHGQLAELIVHAGKNTPEMFHRVLVPLSENDLHRELLNRGCRTVKLMSYMTTGPFTPPVGAWVPCIEM
jgi:predicted N-acetyltransferase YhbS